MGKKKMINLFYCFLSLLAFLIFYYNFNFFFSFLFTVSKKRCSKLFSGNLPELTNHILQYLRNDSTSLYSCTLVIRFFCRIAIPILWEDPFSIECQERGLYNFLDVY